jgi:phosphoribosylanthranilate isomerase
MTINAKICGIKEAAALDAAVAGGARFAGLVFYPRSPRYIAPEDAARLLSGRSDDIAMVGLVVDAGDETLAEIAEQVPLDMLQCHGAETPARISEIRKHFGLPVIKAINIAGPEDVARARGYEDSADWLLFDAKPPKSRTNALPGGNALAFDWTLIADSDWSRPWMLSGGLNPENVAEAVTVSGAENVDVSSGVEDRPGVKSPVRITAFLDIVRSL